MIEIWNVIINDRHCDVEVTGFIDKDAAIQHAKDYLDSVAEGDWEEWTGNPRAFAFFAYYGGDENDVRVVRGELHGIAPVASLPEVKQYVAVGL